ncbi:MAG: hypothetical protein HQ523_05365 [Lentisphaerae bacterium]|nr:hypothetical protein [Lentisphaerota bacterium]
MRLRTTLAVVMLASIACGVAGAAPDLSVLPARVRGVVLLPDGETPVDKL